MKERPLIGGSGLSVDWKTHHWRARCAHCGLVQRCYGVYSARERRREVLCGECLWELIRLSEDAAKMERAL